MIPELEVKEARKKLGQEGVVFLDVRTEEEVGGGRIEGSAWLDIFDEYFADKVEELDRTKSYVVYCHLGGRSAQAVQIMQGLGFEKVWNLVGGIVAWEEEN